MRWYYYLIYRLYEYYQRVDGYTTGKLLMPNMVLTMLWFFLWFPLLRHLLILKYNYNITIWVMLALVFLFYIAHYFIFMKPRKIFNPTFTTKLLGRFFVVYVYLIVVSIGVSIAAILK